MAVVRPLREADCSRIAEIDLAARGEAATLAPLGVPFFKTLYRAFLRSGQFSAFVYEDAHDILGFVLGCTDTRRALRRVVMKAFVPLAIRAGIRCLTRPALIPKVLVTFCYPRLTQPSGPELLVISVDPASQARGVGTALVGVLNKAFRAQGISSYQVTVKQSLEQANRFYRRLEFRLVDQFVFYGEPWNTYEYYLSSGERWRESVASK
jgi:ribosomal protein S18 acetylase RimI-like enzyme